MSFEKGIEDVRANATNSCNGDFHLVLFDVVAYNGTDADFDDSIIRSKRGLLGCFKAVSHRDAADPGSVPDRDAMKVWSGPKL
jgi:hypothetical protein